MTNHWIDLKNSDCILIMGSNAAENHPISMKYVTEAQSRGGKLISVDPVSPGPPPRRTFTRPCVPGPTSPSWAA